jgi:hypothetical protein
MRKHRDSESGFTDFFDDKPGPSRLADRDGEPTL